MTLTDSKAANCVSGWVAAQRNLPAQTALATQGKAGQGSKRVPTQVLPSALCLSLLYQLCCFKTVTLRKYQCHPLVIFKTIMGHYDHVGVASKHQEMPCPMASRKQQISFGRSQLKAFSTKKTHLTKQRLQMHEFLSRQEKSFHETHKMESLKMVHLVEIPIDHIQQLSAII